MDWIKLLLGLILVCTFGCSDGQNSANGGAQNSANGGVQNSADTNAHYALTVAVENGTAAITPDLTSYAAGTSVTIRITPDAGYDFYAWSGDHTGMANPLVVPMNSDMTITAACISVNSVTYYVDYDHGDDGNDGRTPATAWKHAPGDGEAQGNPATVQLEPGAEILFRGSVIYRGRIDIPADGSENHPITYRGNSWPGEAHLKAVIDGGDVITGWTPCQSARACGGNPHYASLYYTYLPASVDPLSVNLHEYDTTTGEDAFLWPAQDPDPSDPYFYDHRFDFRAVPQSRLTRTALTDPDYFDQGDPDDWEDAYILVWINPNIVVTRAITGFDPVTHTVSFDDLGVNAIYPDGRDQAYAIFNSLHALDSAGEYFVATTADDQDRLKVVLWPRSSGPLNQRISYSVRRCGFNIGAHSNITIDGFEVRKHAGAGLRDGVGIGTISTAYLENYNLVIRNNRITHNRKGGSSRGYGGIFLNNSHHCLVENNWVESNPRQAGIFFGGGSHVRALGNTIIRSGSTSLRLYSIDHAELIGNTIADSNGSHANGITIYLHSRNILVANNRVYDSSQPVTFQDSGNLFFINNVIDAGEGGSNVNEWGDTSHGPWERGTIAFFNNTLVRNDRNGALNVGGASDENTYLVINNIIDGGGSHAAIRRSHNIYTGLSWSQSERYGWSLGEEETVEEDLSLLFTDPDAVPGDFHLTAQSPARGAGRDICGLIPAGLFPDFECGTDFNGNRRSVWDIGAFAY
ncbi:MAG: right-handed parallel beta-helix repeat-containing protein [Desulfobacteraceae bacterium]|jgi:hypothetical protein